MVFWRTWHVNHKTFKLWDVYTDLVPSWGCLVAAILKVMMSRLVSADEPTADNHVVLFIFTSLLFIFIYDIVSWFVRARLTYGEFGMFIMSPLDYSEDCSKYFYFFLLPMKCGATCLTILFIELLTSSFYPLGDIYDRRRSFITLGPMLYLQFAFLGMFLDWAR